MTSTTSILSNPHLMTTLNPQQKEVAYAFFSPGKNRKIVALTGPVCSMTNKITNIAVANLIDKRRTTIVVSNKAGKFGPIVISAPNQVLPKEEPLVRSGNLIFQAHDSRPRVMFVAPHDLTSTLIDTLTANSSSPPDSTVIAASSHILSYLDCTFYQRHRTTKKLCEEC